MCGRVVQTTPVGEIAEILGIAHGRHPLGWVPRRNIAPSASLLVAEADGIDTVLRFRRWGLVPHWALDESIGARLANARSETVWERPSFRDAVTRLRCIVPVNGFYEWAPATLDGPRTSSGKPAKRPHLFQAASGRPLLLAGIAADRPCPDGGDPLRTVCLLTTQANGTMSPIHDRMPVLLDSEATDVWLRADHWEARDLLTHLLAPAPDDVLTEYEVSTEVNSARNEGPHLTDPVDVSPTTLF